MQKLTVGADIEMFCYSEGAIVPVTGKLKADKKHPKEIHASGVCVQEDGIAVEMTFPPTQAESFFEVTCDHYSQLRYWMEMEFGYGIDHISEVHVDNVRDYPKTANRLGCDPDYEAYEQKLSEGLKERPTLRIEDFNGWRFASGHIHLGTVGVGHADGIPLPIQAQLADVFLGLPLRYGESGASENERIPFYGRPGLFRPKPYGFEYRTPSNSWLFHGSPMLNMALQAFEELLQRPLPEIKGFYKKVQWSEVRALLLERQSSTNLKRWRALASSLNLEVVAI